jgi:hypothetical protein
MAIDPRISLAATVAPQVNVAKMFYDIKNQQQGLAAGEQGLAAGEQGLALNEQSMALNEQTINQNRDKQRLTNIHQTGQRLKPLIAAGDAQGAELFLLNNISQIQDRIEQGSGEDVTESMETLEKLKAGDLQGVMGDIMAVEGLVRQQQGSGASAGTREFQNLLNIAQNPSSSDVERNAALIKLRVNPGASTSAAERIATNQTLGAQVATQKGSESTATEQAKSDVKIAEAQRLEQETEGGRQGIESRRLNIDETKIKNEQQKQDAINSKNSRRSEADSAVSQVSSLLAGDRFSAAFGKIVTNTPDIAKSQASIDAIADINQIKGLLTLESRQKLKGQGTISDGEQKILAESATVLNNPLISDERARRELRKIRNVFEAASDRNQLKKETKEKPVIIRFDAQGNQI